MVFLRTMDTTDATETEGSITTEGTETEAPEVSPVSPPQENLPKSTPRQKNFGKLQIKINDVKVDDVPQMPEIGEGEEEGGEALSDFTVEDAKLLAQSIWNMPSMMLGDYMEPDPKMVNRWGEQLFRYCERKGINMWDYAFDELPLLMSSAMLGGSMVKKYSEHKKEEDAKKKQEEEETDKEG